MEANYAPSQWVMQPERVSVPSASFLCAPQCFDSLALLNTQSNNSSCGEQRGDTRGEREREREKRCSQRGRSINRVGAVIYLPLCVM